MKLWRNLEVVRFLRLIPLFRDSSTNYVWVLDYTFEFVTVLSRQVLLLCVLRVTLGTRGFSRVRREFSVLAKGWHIFGHRPRVTINTWQKPEAALEKSLPLRVTSRLFPSLKCGSQQAPNDGFLLNALKSLLRLFRVLLDLLEMHPKRHSKVCICSVILGEVESFRNYKGFSYIFPKILDAISRILKGEIFLITVLSHFWIRKF